jgi:hypothetical protein
MNDNWLAGITIPRGDCMEYAVIIAVTTILFFLLLLFLPSLSYY